MFYIKKGGWMLGIPFAFSYLAATQASAVLFVLFIAAQFLILKLIPVFRNYENMGMFIIVAFSSIPVNVQFFRWLGRMGILFDSFVIMNILRVTVYYIVLLSLEEIIMGTVTRLIWKNQKKLSV